MKSEELAARAIAQFHMLDAGERVLVGFSGGADSVCLVSVLVKLGYDVACAHVNHGMRPAAARDEDFCREFCRERGLDFECRRIAPGTLKSEDSARRARYDFFKEVMQKKGIFKLATAHNKNDSAETVLLHLLRGAGTDGLGGIAPSDGVLIRPLIFAKKSEILEYCRENSLSYMTDETNLTDVYARNRLRNSIIPQLEQHFNPRLTDTLADNALYIAEDAAYLEKAAQSEYLKAQRDGGADIEYLKTLDRAVLMRVIRLMWQEASGSGQSLDRRNAESVFNLIAAAKSGSRCDLPGGLCAEVSYGLVAIKKLRRAAEYAVPLEIGKWQRIPGTTAEIRVRGGAGGLELSLDGTETLEMRSKADGDRFSPSGMKGTKKLSDFFTDAKIPREKRGEIPVLTADGKIFAVGNMRADNDFLPGKKKLLCSVEIRRV